MSSAPNLAAGNSCQDMWREASGNCNCQYVQVSLNGTVFSPIEGARPVSRMTGVTMNACRESGCLRTQPKAGGILHRKLNRSRVR